MNGKEIRQALHRGQTVFGTAMISQSPHWPGILTSVGLDFVFIDTEHTPLGRETVSAVCHLYKGVGVAPIVRIPSPDSFQATMVLDGGATGVIVPYVESVEQVRELVGAVKYKPLKGARLTHFLKNEKDLEPELHDYLIKHNEETVLIVNIESTPAIDALDEILEVDGLDGVLVGPHDLTCSLGIPEQYQHPLFMESIELIIDKAKSKQVGVGIHVWDAVGFNQEIEWVKRGANLVVHSNDLSLLSATLQTNINNLKSAIGQSVTDDQGAEPIV